MLEVWREQLALLPGYLAAHILLTLSALALSTAVSVPLGVLIADRPRVRNSVLAAVNVVQTIPALALLAFMMLLLGRIGFVPAFLAIALYSILPILRNTIVGLAEVDKSIIEAGRGMGMHHAQILLQVQLPLAMPVIIAGFRTAAIWTVGMATLATPIGATSLGNYIFSGLQTRNNVALAIGCVSSALLALALDGLVQRLERLFSGGDMTVAAYTARGARWLQGRLSKQTAVLITATLIGAVCAGITLYLAWPREQPLIAGGKGFTEQYITAGLLAAQLEEAGLPARARTQMGSTVIFEALTRSEVACYVEYSGTLWANEMKRSDNPGARAVTEEVTRWLDTEHDVLALPPLGFENRYCLAMRRDDAKRRGIRTIEDLAAQSGALRIGSDFEFFSRPEWFALRDGYGLKFRQQVTLDSTLMYSAIAQGEVEVITAYTTDGRIDSFDLAILEDPKEIFLPYEALVLIAPKQRNNPALLGALAPLVGKIDNSAMRKANGMVDVEHKSIEAAAEALRERLP